MGNTSLLRLTVALTLFALAPAAAQPACRAMLRGRVLDRHDLSPLAFAQIQLPGQQRSTLSDSTGAFAMSGLCPGPALVITRHIGCEPDTSLLEIGGPGPVMLYLEHHSELLAEITLTARTTAPHSAPQERVELQGSPQRAGSLAESLAQMQGVNRLETGAGIQKVMIRGMHSSRVVTLQQGLRQEDQQWNLNHAPSLSPFSASEIVVTKGAASISKAFGAVGGVVELLEAPLPTGTQAGGELLLRGQSQGRGGAGGLQYGAGLAPKWGYRLSAFAERYGDRQAPDYLLSNTALQSVHLAGSMGYYAKKWQSKWHYSHYANRTGLLRSAHIGNLTDFEQALSQNRPWYVEDFSYAINAPRQEVVHQLASWQGRWELNQDHTLEVNSGWQHNSRQEYDVRRGGRSDIPAVDMRLQTYTARVEHRYRRARYHESLSGITALQQENRNQPGTGVNPILPNYNRWQAGLYSVQKFKPYPWFWEVGLRYDRHGSQAFFFDRQEELQQPRFAFHNAAAHAGARYFFSGTTSLSSHLALVMRSPEVHELLSDGLHQGSASIELGNPHLRPERSLNWNHSLQIQKKDHRWQIDAYINYFAGFIYRQPDPEPLLTIRGAFPVFRYRQSDALLSGLEWSMEQQAFRQMTYQAQASWLYAQNLSERKPLILMPPWELEHSLQRSFSLPYVGSWNLKVRQQLVARQFRFPAGEDLAPPPGGFQLWHLSLGSDPAASPGPWSWRLTVHNIFNTRYRSYLNQQRYFADSEGTNFSIMFNYKFQNDED